MVLMEMVVKGSGDRTKLEFYYRTMNGSTESLVFTGLSMLSNARWHSLVLHVYSNSFDTSGVDLYIDCAKVEHKQSVSPLNMVFSYRGIRLSRMEFRIGSRRKGRRVTTQWKVFYMLDNKIEYFQPHPVHQYVNYPYFIHKISCLVMRIKQMIIHSN